MRFNKTITGILGGVTGAAAMAVFAATGGVQAKDNAILTSPGKHIIAEQAIGIRDGLATYGEIDEGINQRLAAIAQEREAEVTRVLKPVYDAAYMQAVSGNWSMLSLNYFVSAIETDDATVTLARAAAERAITATWNTDSIDTTILSSITEAGAIIKVAAGEEQKRIFSNLIMVEIAHDEMREAFYSFTAGDDDPSISEESLEGFLKATNIIPQDEVWAFRLDEMGPQDGLTLDF